MKFINALLWFIGLFLCLLAVLGFVNGNFLFSLFFLLIGILLLPPVYTRIKKMSK